MNNVVDILKCDLWLCGEGSGSPGGAGGGWGRVVQKVAQFTVLVKGTVVSVDALALKYFIYLS